MTTNQLTTAYSKNAHITTGKNVITDYFIEPGDYLKIDNVTLGYTMNLNKKYIEKDTFCSVRPTIFIRLRSLPV